jgi:MarR family 2-MHQ and catechol resistance regulon transcriptional repressor
VELPHLKDDPHLKLVRPLVEAYLAFWRSELSEQTLVTKGTLTGVLDRLVAKGLIRRDAIRKDRRYTKVSLTAKGEVLFRKTFAAHVDFLRPFFERALSGQEVEQVCLSLGRLRDSFQKEMDVRTSRRRLV